MWQVRSYGQSYSVKQRLRGRGLRPHLHCALQNVLAPACYDDVMDVVPHAGAYAYVLCRRLEHMGVTAIGSNCVVSKASAMTTA